MKVKCRIAPDQDRLTVNWASYSPSGELLYGFKEIQSRLPASECVIYSLNHTGEEQEWIEAANRTRNLPKKGYPSLTDVQWMVLFGLAADPHAVISTKEYEALRERGYLSEPGPDFALTDKATALLAAVRRLPEPVEKTVTTWEMPS